jgi:hypothetical protein
MLVDFACFAVAIEEAAEDAEAAHPKEAGWHAGVCGTLALAWTAVATLSLGLKVGTVPGSGADCLWLADDKTIFDQLADVLA